MGPGNNAWGLCDAEPELDALEALDARLQREAGGEKCAIVRIERYSVRTLDIDNAYGGIKALVDALCESGLISGDDPTKITLSFQQFKVPHLKDKKTVIKIRYPR